MEAIGQLTGGVAHDFNNVLQAVTGNLELIRRRVRDGRTGDVARLAGSALEAAGKAAGLTAQLLAFARRQRLDPKPLDPARVAAGMHALLARTAGERIVLRLEVEEGAGLPRGPQPVGGRAAQSRHQRPRRVRRGGRNPDRLGPP